jgi:large subunit ribosomal protein L3
MKFLLGKKLGMTTLQDPQKGALNVTLIECDQNTVTVLRTPERDGYAAVQVEAAKTSKKRMRKEFRLDHVRLEADEVKKELEKFKEGDTLDVTVFSVGDVVSVSGITKAKGFQGVVKRHGFKGSPRTHGHKHDLRAPGSIGSQENQRVIKGMRMAGRMGGDRSTTKNVKVVYVNQEKGLIGVQGAVPGVSGRMVEVWANTL